MVLNPDFREFVASLNDRKVRYLVVGGYAVAFHGHPRYTKDLDVWINRDVGNAERLLLALTDFGFGAVGLTAKDFLEPDQVVQLGYPPNRIDLITKLAGVDFDTCYPHRETLNVEGIPIAFIDLKHLRQNKRAVGRYQDLADLDNLE